MNNYCKAKWSRKKLFYPGKCFSVSEGQNTSSPRILQIKLQKPRKSSKYACHRQTNVSESLGVCETCCSCDTFICETCKTSDNSLWRFFYHLSGCHTPLRLASVFTAGEGYASLPSVEVSKKEQQSNPVCTWKKKIFLPCFFKIC